MSVARIATHQADAFNRLLSQSRRPNMTALLGCMTSLVQQAEDGIAPLQESRFLSNAFGQALDGVGEIVNQPRNGQIDSVYRLFLQARIYASASDSTTPTITELVQTLFGAKAVQVVSQSSAGFAHRRSPGVLGIEIGSPSLDRSLWQQAITLVRDSLAAAVSISWVSVYDVAATYALDGPVAGQGLDGATVAEGMAELIFSDMGS